MKKLLLFLLAAYAFISSGFTQSIILTSPNAGSYGLVSAPNVVVNNDTITYCVADMVNIFDAGEVFCINNTGSPMAVNVHRFADQYACFTSNQYCWTICYNPATSISPDSLVIPANDTSIAFHGWATPNGHPGCCFIKYRFSNEYDTTQFADVTIKYCFSSNCSAPDLGNEELSIQQVLLYPNPASGWVNLNVESMNASGVVSILDVSGKEVKILYIPQHSTQVNIPVNDLGNGIYFCTLKVNGKTMVTRKLVVENK
jgi:hypothetical protein